MKSLHEIEQHARELAGGEFRVSLDSDGWTVPMVVIEFEDDSSNEAWFFEEPAMNKIGIDESPVDYARLARFVSLCSQLDTWIKGDAK